MLNTPTSRESGRPRTPGPRRSTCKRSGRRLQGTSRARYRSAERRQQNPRRLRHIQRRLLVMVLVDPPGARRMRHSGRLRADGGRGRTWWQGQRRRGGHVTVQSRHGPAVAGDSGLVVLASASVHAGGAGSRGTSQPGETAGSRSDPTGVRRAARAGSRSPHLHGAPLGSGGELGLGSAAPARVRPPRRAVTAFSSMLRVYGSHSLTPSDRDEPVAALSSRTTRAARQRQAGRAAELEPLEVLFFLEDDGPPTRGSPWTWIRPAAPRDAGRRSAVGAGLGVRAPTVTPLMPTLRKGNYDHDAP